MLTLPEYGEVRIGCDGPDVLKFPLLLGCEKEIFASDPLIARRTAASLGWVEKHTGPGAERLGHVWLCTKCRRVHHE